MLKKIIILNLITALTALQGCVKSDIDWCDPGVEISFEYVLHSHEAGDLFAAQVQDVSVVVFDKDKLYVDTYHESVANIIAAGNRMPLPLKNGDYTVLVLGGTLSSYTIGEKLEGEETVRPGLRAGITKLENFRFSLNKAATTRTGDDAEPPVPMFFGAEKITAQMDQVVRKKISLTKNTSTIRFVITEIPMGFAPGDPSQMYYSCNLGRNTMINSENNIAAQSPLLAYIPTEYRTGNGPVYEIDVPMFRLQRGVPVDAKLQDIATGLYLLNEPDLVAFLMRSPEYNSQEDLDKEDLFEIELQLERGVDITVTVSINGWVVKEIYPDFD